MHISSAGGCPYLYSGPQDIKFLLIQTHISINMSLLKIIIPCLSWPPSLSSSFHLRLIHSPYKSLRTHPFQRFTPSYLTSFPLLQLTFLLQLISNLHIPQSVHCSLLYDSSQRTHLSLPYTMMALQWTNTSMHPLSLVLLLSSFCLQSG